MADMQVELVAADRIVWSGEVRILITRTLDGELGIMANHAPTMSVLSAGTVEMRAPDGGYLVAAIDGGFISVANNHVSILAEHATMSDDIDVEQARRELEQVNNNGQAAADPGADQAGVQGRAELLEARIAAAEKAS
ncbi:MAG: F0F1 ATP synthase subunit epsilon [Nocardioidaceae bacterium]